MDAPDQKIARDVDIGSVAHGAGDDRLDHRENVFDAVIEFVDHRRQPVLEPDPHPDFAAHTHVVVGDVTEQAADDRGQRETDRRHHRRQFERALFGIGFGVIGQLPVAAAERHGPHHRGGTGLPSSAVRTCGRATTRSFVSTTSSVALLAALRSAMENNDISSLVSIRGASS